MKKFLSIILSVSILLGLCACGNSTQNSSNKLIGKWTYTYDDDDYTSYEFFSNGTIYKTYDDSYYNRTEKYSLLDGTRINIGGKVYEFHINGNILSLTDDKGYTTEYVKE